MAETTPVLVIDDGELDDLVGLLAELDVPFRRVRGSLFDALQEPLDPPGRLLVTTPRRVEMSPGGPREATEGDRPLRVVSSQEDSNPLRASLRRLGFDLLVRRPTHREVWRLLIQRALYRGRERRQAARVPVGSPAELAGEAGAETPVLLVDLSNRGCNLLLDTVVERGDEVRVSLPAGPGEPDLVLRGRVVRAEPAPSGQTRVGLLFDRDLDPESRTRLGTLLNTWSTGTGTGTRGPAEPGHRPLPACESPAIPGLTLDDETDPAIAARMPVGIERSGSDRREHARRVFSGSVEAEGPGGRAVLIGRDLSAGGMRIEALPGLALGDRFRVAIYGPEQVEPYRVESEVVRDDGEAGLALRFLDVTRPVAAALEKIVACLPDVEPLQDGEAGGLGSVITEIVPDGIED